MTAPMPDLRTVPTAVLEQWLRAGSVPPQDVPRIEEEYTRRLTQEFLATARGAATPMGWYDDPVTPGMQRWWDGTAWTDQQRRRPRR